MEQAGVKREAELNLLEPGKGAARRAGQSQQPGTIRAIVHPPEQLHHCEEGH